jgi:hypothetical protein
MRRDLWIRLLVVALVVAIAAPASAIMRGGTPDGDDHPYVGLMVAGVEVEDDEAGEKTFGPRWRCSGALIAPDVYVTAGHCTYGADRVEIWFESDLHAGGGLVDFPSCGETAVGYGLHQVKPQV